MKILLYTPDRPHGRCLLLAQQFHEVTSMAASDCVQIAERLFASHHQRDNPVIVDVPESRSADELEATCADLGIAVEGAER